MINTTANAGMACECARTGKAGRELRMRLHLAQILCRVEIMAGHQISRRRQPLSVRCRIPPLTNDGLLDLW